MKIRALESFSGAFSMYRGEVKECSDKAILQDLLKAKYVEEVEEKSDKPSEDGPQDKNPPEEPKKVEEPVEEKSDKPQKGVKANAGK